MFEFKADNGARGGGAAALDAGVKALAFGFNPELDSPDDGLAAGLAGFAIGVLVRETGIGLLPDRTGVLGI